jgi:hypothetical protein
MGTNYSTLLLRAESRPIASFSDMRKCEGDVCSYQ